MSADRGRVEREEFARELLDVSSGFHVRLFLALTDDDEWHVCHGVAVAQVGDSRPVDVAWRYRRARFLAASMDANRVAGLCGLGDESTLELDDISVVVERSQPSIEWRREPSRALHDRTPLPWPSRDFTISPAEGHDQEPQCGLLVGEECPSFYDLRTGFRAFFDSDLSLVGAGAIPTSLAQVRLPDLRGAIGEVDIGPTGLTAEIRGGDLEGMTLELFDPLESQSVRLTGPGDIEISFRSGPPQQGCLWLKRGYEWFDYRPLIAPWLRPDEGVVVDQFKDPEAVVEALIASGEGPQLEFKSRIPDSATARRAAFKTVAAFANGSGGTVIFGVEPDEVSVAGIAGEPNALRDELAGMVRARVTPTPPFEIVTAQLAGGLVLLLHVSPGPSAPYGITVDKGSQDRPEFYVRRGASTYPAQPSDIRESVLARGDTK